MVRGEQGDWLSIRKALTEDGISSPSLAGDEGRMRKTADCVFGFFIVCGAAVALALIAILWIVSAFIRVDIW